MVRHPTWRFPPLMARGINFLRVLVRNLPQAFDARHFGRLRKPARYIEGRVSWFKTPTNNAPGPQTRADGAAAQQKLMEILKSQFRPIKPGLTCTRIIANSVEYYAQPGPRFGAAARETLSGLDAGGIWFWGCRHPVSGRNGFAAHHRQRPFASKQARNTGLYMRSFP